jgi:Flp pilus assembly protein TadG
MRRIFLVLCRRMIAARDGAAAIEFAFLAPIMVAMFFGAVELSVAITTERRVAQVAGSAGDLVARADRTINVSEVTDIMQIGSYMLDAASIAPLRIEISNVTSSPTDPKNTTEAWRCVFVGGTLQTNCSCTSVRFDIPEGLIGANDSVVVAKATYAYTPLGFGNIIGDDVIPFETVRYLKPRTQSAKLRFSNNTVC